MAKEMDVQTGTYNAAYEEAKQALANRLYTLETTLRTCERPIP